MRAFFDTSAYAKRFIFEAGSEEVEKICMNSDELGLSLIYFPEIISALNRRKREKNITEREYHGIKFRIDAESQDISLVDLNYDVLQETMYLLENFSLRALDSIHIASAVIWKADIFVSADKRQLDAARITLPEIVFVGES